MADRKRKERNEVRRNSREKECLGKEEKKLVPKKKKKTLDQVKDEKHKTSASIREKEYERGVGLATAEPNSFS